MKSSHWFPWPMLFFLFIIIYCPIVAGRLPSVKFPTQRTGNCSTASDFLGLIFTETGRDLPTSGSFVPRLPWLCKPLWGHFLPGTQRRRPPGLSPTQPLGKAPLSAPNIMSFLFNIWCLLSLEPALWECSFQGRQWGTTEQTWWNHSALARQAFQSFVIRKQNPQPQCQRCLHALWLLKYVLIKSFITSALSTPLNAGY